MSEKYYYLKDRELIECDSIEDYAKLVRRYGENQHVELHRLIVYKKDIVVSTVCLMKDHSMLPTCFPIVFETMVFVNEQAGFCERYSKYEDALEGHFEILEKVKTGRI